MKSTAEKPKQRKESVLKLRVYKFCERCKTEMAPGDTARKVGNRYYHQNCNKPSNVADVPDPSEQKEQAKRELAGSVLQMLEDRQRVGEDLGATMKRLVDHWDNVLPPGVITTQQHLENLRSNPNLPRDCTFQEFQQLYCKGASEASALRCWRRMLHTGLNPETGHIFFKQVGPSEYDPIVTIHGMRLVAKRSGRMNGEGPPEWCGEDGAWKTSWAGPGAPAEARFTLFLKDQQHPVFGVANYKEHCPKLRDGTRWKSPEHWDQRPARQIGKCAEADAFRKAFPDELGDTYAPEEREEIIFGFDPATGVDESAVVAFRRNKEGLVTQASFNTADLVKAAEASWAPQGSGWGIDQPSQAQHILDTSEGKHYAGSIVSLFRDPGARAQFLASEQVSATPTAQQLPGLIAFLQFIAFGRMRGLRDEEIDHLANVWGLTAPRWKMAEKVALRQCDLQNLSDSDLISLMQRAGMR